MSELCKADIAKTAKVRSARRLRRQRGNTLLEGALTFLATMLLIIGTLDLGQMLMQLQAFNERARATARWAATHPFNTQTFAEVKNWACYGSTSAPGATGDASVATGFFGLQPSHVSVSLVGTADTSDYAVKVSISKPMTFLSPYIYGSYTMKPAVAVSPMEQQ